MPEDANTRLIATGLAQIEAQLEALRDSCDDDQVDELESGVHDLVRDVMCAIGWCKPSSSEAIELLRKVAPLDVAASKLRKRIADEVGAFAEDEQSAFAESGERLFVAHSPRDAVKLLVKLLRRFDELDPERPEVEPLLELVVSGSDV